MRNLLKQQQITDTDKDSGLVIVNGFGLVFHRSFLVYLLVVHNVGPANLADIDTK